MNLRACLAAAVLSLAGRAAMADPIAVLFVGDSFTFGRVEPVLSYNAAHVHDLTAAFDAVSSAGSNAYEPHPWGGVPGLFKKFTDEAGLDYDVSISARNAASLRSQFLNTANAAWDLRGNVASRRWDAVVLQERSDAALPAGKGKHADVRRFDAYADRFERFIHVGDDPANPNASAATRVYLTDTWARPDMVFAHRITTPDRATSDGRPVVDTSRRGGAATLYYASLAAMTSDLHDAFAKRAATNPKFAGVVPVGDAFQLAVDLGLAKSSGFYDSRGVRAENAPGALLNLWWDDGLHASKYGSYLDALVQFGTITGLDPSSLGANEQAAADLGIGAADAVTLQRVASQQIARAVGR